MMQQSFDFSSDRERDETFLRLYSDGLTLQKIGDKYSLTRQRVQQILVRAMSYKLAADIGYTELTTEMKELLTPTAKEELNALRVKREQSVVDEALSEAALQGIRPESFTSVRKFSNLVGITISELKEHSPEAVKLIKNNRSKQWSAHYRQCRNCGTTAIKHRCFGLCQKCFFKSDYWTETAAENYQKLQEKKYGGNREAAIQLHNDQCAHCKISREDCREKYGRDLFVTRKNGDPEDNTVENLLPLCIDCFAAFKIENGRFGRGRRKRRKG